MTKQRITFRLILWMMIAIVAAPFALVMVIVVLLQERLGWPIGELGQAFLNGLRGVIGTTPTDKE